MAMSMGWAAPTVQRDEDVNGNARNRFVFDPAAMGFAPGTNLVGIDENSFVATNQSGMNQRFQNVGGRAQLVDTYKPDARPWYMNPAVGALLAVGGPLALGYLGAAGAAGAATGGGSAAGGAGAAGTAAAAPNMGAAMAAAGSATTPAAVAGSGMPSLATMGSTVANWVRQNPATALRLGASAVGAVAGAQGARATSGGPPAPSGPPVQWSSPVRPQAMPQPMRSQAGALPFLQGNGRAGASRFVQGGPPPAAMGAPVAKAPIRSFGGMPPQQGGMVGAGGLMGAGGMPQMQGGMVGGGLASAAVMPGGVEYMINPNGGPSIPVPPGGMMGAGGLRMQPGGGLIGNNSLFRG